MVTAFVPPTRAKLRALQMKQRKTSLLSQKQRLCRNWAPQQARAALKESLPPGCVTKQTTGSFHNIPVARLHRRILSLLLTTKSQTLLKARTQQSPQQREGAKLCLVNKQVLWSYHMPVLVARRKRVKFQSEGCLSQFEDCLGIRESPKGLHLTKG